MGRVTVFVAEECIESQNVRHTLRSHSIPFYEICVTTYPRRRVDMIKMSGCLTAPQVFFNDEHMGGSMELSALFREFNQVLVFNSAYSSVREWITNEVLMKPSPSKAIRKLLRTKQKGTTTSALSPNKIPSIEEITNLFKSEHDIVKLGNGVEVGVIAITRSLMNVLPHKKSFRFRLVSKSQISGARAVKVFMQHYTFQTVEGASQFGQTLIHLGILHRITTDKVTCGLFDVRGQYKLQPLLNPDVLNTLRIFTTASGLRELFPDPQPLATLSQMFRLMTSIITSATTATGKLDYSAIQDDAKMDSLEEGVCRLQLADPKAMNESSKKAFFINVHNLMMMHAFVKLRPKTINSNFFLSVKYNIGGHVLSLYQIVHGVLGAVSSDHRRRIQEIFPNDSDPRRAFCLERKDDRIQFALNDGSGRCTATHEYHAEAINQELHVVAEQAEWSSTNNNQSKRNFLKDELKEKKKSFANRLGTRMISLRKNDRRLLKNKSKTASTKDQNHPFGSTGVIQALGRVMIRSSIKFDSPETNLLHKGANPHEINNDGFRHYDFEGYENLSIHSIQSVDDWSRISKAAMNLNNDESRSIKSILSMDDWSGISASILDPNNTTTTHSRQQKIDQPPKTIIQTTGEEWSVFSEDSAIRSKRTLKTLDPPSQAKTLPNGDSSPIRFIEIEMQSSPESGRKEMERERSTPSAKSRETASTVNESQDSDPNSSPVTVTKIGDLLILPREIEKKGDIIRGPPLIQRKKKVNGFEGPFMSNIVGLEEDGNNKTDDRKIASGELNFSIETKQEEVTVEKKIPPKSDIIENKLVCKGPEFPIVHNEEKEENKEKKGDPSDDVSDTEHYDLFDEASMLSTIMSEGEEEGDDEEDRDTSQFPKLQNNNAFEETPVFLGSSEGHESHLPSPYMFDETSIVSTIPSDHEDFDDNDDDLFQLKNEVSFESANTTGYDGYSATGFSIPDSNTFAGVSYGESKTESAHNIDEKKSTLPPIEQPNLFNGLEIDFGRRNNGVGEGISRMQEGFDTGSDLSSDNGENFSLTALTYDYSIDEDGSDLKLSPDEIYNDENLSLSDGSDHGNGKRVDRYSFEDLYDI